MTNDTYVDPADMDDATALTLEWGDIKMACRVTENTLNPLLGTRTIKFVPYEDSIHPSPLAFEPPLIEHAVGDNNGFAHQWEKLNYAFALPNPAAFPKLTTLTDDDKEVLRRFVSVCRQLAGYSALNNESGINIKGINGGQPDIELEFPTPEAFGGTSLAFRQLHSQEESASFDRAKGRLMRAIKLLPEPEQEAPKDLVVQWSRARAKLMNRLLQNVVCEMAAPPVTSGPPIPFSYCNINPQELILTFNYGDTIHFSKEKEKLANLLDDERNQAYYRHAVLLAITNLSHLYFGFAVLAEAAMGSSLDV
jgi:hypothetical protein